MATLGIYLSQCWSMHKKFHDKKKLEYFRSSQMLLLNVREHSILCSLAGLSIHRFMDMKILTEEFLNQTDSVFSGERTHKISLPMSSTLRINSFLVRKYKDSSFPARDEC